MTSKIHWFIFISLTFSIHCTKKKEPAPEEPANLVAEMPQDSKHKQETQQETLKQDENGAIFEKQEVTPIMIMKMQEISNKKSAQMANKLNTDQATQLFVTHCSRCHGVSGEGDGPQSGSLPISPTNFKQWKFKFGATIEDIVYTITYGRSENEMPSFRGQIKDDELWQIARLVESWSTANNP